jgi:hypothetical protein
MGTTTTIENISESRAFAYTYPSQMEAPIGKYNEVTLRSLRLCRLVFLFIPSLRQVLVCCQVDTSIVASSSVIAMDMSNSGSAVGMLYSTPHVHPMISAFVRSPTDSLAFSLLRHCSDPSTLSIKLMVEAITFISQTWHAQPAQVNLMRGVSRPSATALLNPGLVLDSILKRRKVKKVFAATF